MKFTRTFLVAAAVGVLFMTSSTQTASAVEEGDSAKAGGPWQAAMDAGSSFYKASKYDQAEEQYAKAVALAESENLSTPRLIECKSWLAEVYSQERKRDECRKAKEEVLAIAEKFYGKDDPGILECLCTLAQTLALQKDFEHAASVFARAKQIDTKFVASTAPDDNKRRLLAKTINNLGVIYQVSGHNAEAEDAYSEAIRIAPDYRTAWVNRSGVRHNTGNETASLEDLAEARRLGYDPKQLTPPKSKTGGSTEKP